MSSFLALSFYCQDPLEKSEWIVGHLNSWMKQKNEWNESNERIKQQKE